jgi:signal peptidase
LIQKIRDGKAEVGDVIQFKKDNILISHRVIEIVTDDKGFKYRTKGDNNSGEDMELVKPENIRGKLISVIPKIGWPTLLIKQSEDLSFEKISNHSNNNK